MQSVVHETGLCWHAAGVRSIAFPANGDCLLAATQDGLRAWAWEPVRRLDTVDVPWAKVTCMNSQPCLCTMPFFLEPRGYSFA